MENKIKESAVLVVMDVKGLYDNIPPKEGVECVENGLEDSVNSKVPKEFIARLLEVVLEYSIFEFNQKLYQQRIGTSMGCRPAIC